MVRRNRAGQYEDLEDAKSDVQRWYARSERTPWLFGNGGRKLPRHSLFGQSFGDLEAAKGRRGDAVDEIGDCKSEIASIKAAQSRNKLQRDRNHAEIGQVLASITQVKAARQRMFDLRDEGVRPQMLQRALSQLRASQQTLEQELLSLERRRNALVEETEHRMGMMEREAAIADLLTRKQQFLDEFGSPESRTARLAQHRRGWMSSHG